MRVSKLILILTWLSIFALAWLMIFGIAPREPITAAGFIFFFLIAFFSGAVEQTYSKKELHNE